MNKKIKILIFASGVLLAILIFFFVYRFFIQADTVKTVTIAGNIFVGLSDEKSATPAPNCQVMVVDPYNLNPETTTTDANGHFTLTIKNPARYQYRLIAGGGEYSARVLDKLTLDPLPQEPAYQNLSYNVDKQVQLMWSNYFKKVYKDGYSDDNMYRITKNDIHYIKNLVSSNEIYLNPTVPDKAQLKIKIKDIKDLPPNQDPQNPTAPIKATLQVMPTKSNWEIDSQASLGSVIATKDITIDQSLIGQELVFDVDLGSLPVFDRFYALIDGFAIGMTLAPESSSLNPTLSIEKLSDTSNQINYQGSNSIRDLTLGTVSCGRGSCNCSKLAGLTTIDFLGRELTVNQAAAGAFTKVADEIKTAGLDKSYNFYNPACSFQGGGGFVCRKITNGSYPSNHAYGVAVDLNPGCNGDQHNSDGSCVTNFPAEIVSIFKNNNFLWGGDYVGYCDAMHFEWYGWTPWETY